MKYNTRIEDELDKIKLKIYEEIKDMSDDEIVAYYNNFGDAVAKKYGFKVAKPNDN